MYLHRAQRLKPVHTNNKVIRTQQQNPKISLKCTITNRPRKVMANGWAKQNTTTSYPNLTCVGVDEILLSLDARAELIKDVELPESTRTKTE
jgi:hypothetical protein